MTTTLTLLIDAGNTRLKYALLDSHGRRDPTQTLPDLSALTALLQQYRATRPIRRIVAVHVLDNAFELALNQIAQHHACDVHYVRTQAQAYGVRVAYAQPAHFGADRFVTLVGIRELYPDRACIVAGCGTAVTIDAILPNGEHQGGVILAGMRLSGEALVARAKASHLSMSFDNIHVFSKQTAQAIGSGSVFGLTAALVGIAQRMEQQLQQKTQRILTGGDAEYLQNWLPSSLFEVRKNVIMIGLQRIAEDFPCING